MAAITTDAATARERLFHIIQTLEDERVIGLYEFLKDEDDTDEFTDEINARIEKVRADYTNGEMGNFLTAEQLHTRLNKLRNTK